MLSRGGREVVSSQETGGLEAREAVIQGGNGKRLLWDQAGL